MTTEIISISAIGWMRNAVGRRPKPVDLMLPEGFDQRRCLVAYKPRLLMGPAVPFRSIPVLSFFTLFPLPPFQNTVSEVEKEYFITKLESTPVPSCKR